MNRWNLAVAGTVGVGAVVLAAWFFLLPYTMGTTSSPSFLLELRQRWNDSRGRAPETPTLQPLMAEVRAQAAAKPGQKVVVDSTHSFSLVVPATWAVVSQADGKVELVSASTTLKFLYPAATTEVLAGATTTASELDGAPAITAVATSSAQVVSQAASGYVVLLAAGPDSASLIAQLAAGVYLSQ